MKFTKLNKHHSIDKPHYVTISLTTQAHTHAPYANNGIILETRGLQNTFISTQFTREIYDKCVKRLTRRRTPRPDNIPNNIIKIIPPQ